MAKTDLVSAAAPFDLDEIAALDTSPLPIKRPDGTETGWVLDLAGPAHPETLKLQDEALAAAQRRTRSQEQARVNGKKYTPPDESPQEARERLAVGMARRIVGWNPVKFGGKDFPYSPENAAMIMLTPKFGQVAVQVMDYLQDEQSFSRRSQRT